MGPPHLTFFCELDGPALRELFADPALLQDLTSLSAAVSLGILDLGRERADVVQRLNHAGIPVIAWLLLPKEQGYWFNLENARQARARYAELQQWTTEHHLRWDGIGLDIETDIREMEGLLVAPWKRLPTLVKRVLDTERLRRAQTAYGSLIAEIHAGGYRVDAYHMPYIVDERQAGSTLVQRLAGLVDIPVDREVLMLYTSLFRPYGPGILSSYAPHAQAVGVGVTGGGVQLTIQIPPLTWGEFARDLLLSRQHTDDVHVFSLEGCVHQGFLPRLKDFDWGVATAAPQQLLSRVEAVRLGLRAVLWMSAHPWLLLAGAAAATWLSCRKRR